MVEVPRRVLVAVVSMFVIVPLVSTDSDSDPSHRSLACDAGEGEAPPSVTRGGAAADRQRDGGATDESQLLGVYLRTATVVTFGCRGAKAEEIMHLKNTGIRVLRDLARVRTVAHADEIVRIEDAMSSNLPITDFGVGTIFVLDSRGIPTREGDLTAAKSGFYMAPYISNLLFEEFLVPPYRAAERNRPGRPNVIRFDGPDLLPPPFRGRWSVTWSRGDARTELSGPFEATAYDGQWRVGGQLRRVLRPGGDLIEEATGTWLLTMTPAEWMWNLTDELPTPANYNAGQKFLQTQGFDSVAISVDYRMSRVDPDTLHERKLNPKLVEFVKREIGSTAKN